jgi:YD repeat-containing protein
VRKTEYQYITRNDSTTYFVDRKWSENIKNGQDEWLGRTVYGYDGFQPNVALGTKGALNYVRKFYSILIGDGQRSTTFPSEAYTSDTTYGYDNYGNQTTVTTYASNGTVWGLNTASPTWGDMGGNSAARTTTTIYEPNLTTPPRTSEPAFHSFPLEVKPPAANGVVLQESAYYDYRMGTMTSVKDPNNQITSAEYDEFGRMLVLRKPGDGTPYAPTVQAEYHDADIPFRYQVSMKENNSGGASRPINALSTSFTMALGARSR